MKQSSTKVDRHGRVVIPVEYRRTLGWREGDEVMLLLDEGVLRVLTRSEAIRRAQELVTKHIEAGRSLIDELSIERRAEAARE